MVKEFTMKVFCTTKYSDRQSLKLPAACCFSEIFDRMYGVRSFHRYKGLGNEFSVLTKTVSRGIFVCTGFPAEDGLGKKKA